MTVSPRRDLAGRGVVDDTAAWQDLCQAPVHDLNLAERADHHVGGLQVAMDHAPGMGVGDGLRDRLEDRQEAGQSVGRALPRLEQLGQRVSLHQLHGEKRPFVGKGAQLVNRHDAGVLELPADLCLFDKPADHVGVAAHVFAENLEGDVATEVRIAPLQDLAHAAAGDLAVDPIASRGVVAVGWADDRRGFFADGGVAEQDARDGSDCGADRVEHRARPCGQVECPVV